MKNHNQICFDYNIPSTVTVTISMYNYFNLYVYYVCKKCDKEVLKLFILFRSIKIFYFVFLNVLIFSQNIAQAYYQNQLIVFLDSEVFYLLFHNLLISTHFPANPRKSMAILSSI